MLPLLLHISTVIQGRESTEFTLTRLGYCLWKLDWIKVAQDTDQRQRNYSVAFQEKYSKANSFQELTLLHGITQNSLRIFKYRMCLVMLCFAGY